jgi:hypothetical protein
MSRDLNPIEVDCTCGRPLAVPREDRTGRRWYLLPGTHRDARVAQKRLERLEAGIRKVVRMEPCKGGYRLWTQVLDQAVREWHSEEHFKLVYRPETGAEDYP